MPFSDWPRRWWLRPGEVAAYINVPGRPTAKLVFDDDDGNLWGFKLVERPDESKPRQPIFDHNSHCFAYGLDRNNADDQPLIDAVYEICGKLMGAPQHWMLAKEHLAVLSVLANDLANAPRISGRKLRAILKKAHGISERDYVDELTKQLAPRFLARLEGPDGDYYGITLPGLLKSDQADRAKKVILSVMTVCDVNYNGVAGQDGDPDFRGFRLDDLMRVKQLADADRGFAIHAVDVLMLGTHDNTNAGFHAGNPGWIRPADVEFIANANTVEDFWSATRKQNLVERPWPTAPLRLEETVNETRRRSRVGEPDRSPVRGTTQSVTPPEVANRIEPTRDVAQPPDGSLNLKETAPVKKYDVALSFAGPDRAHAKALAERIEAAGFDVFYDEYEQGTLWGKDLYVHLHDVYCNRSRFCVMFLSKAYAERLWTNHERAAAQERAFKEKGDDYILPVKIDDTKIPGIRDTIGYLDIAMGIDRIASLLIERLSRPT